jgi:hypothetical protein
MKRKSTVILPLASALGALAGTAVVTAEASTPAQSAEPSNSTATEQSAVRVEPNTLVSTGETLLGFVVKDKPDGTVVAQHVSHASHASHASHYSSR